MRVGMYLGKAQWSVFKNDSRFRVLVAGRRFGKTHLAVTEMVRAAISLPDQLVWYVAPTYRMAEDVAWKLLLRAIPPTAMGKNPDNTDLTITLLNGSVIQLRSADNPDRLRGTGVDFLVIDEAALILLVAWTQVLRANISDTLGRVLFITTPRGFNWIYDLYLEGADPEKPEWAAWQYTTLDGGRVPKEEVEAARSDLPDSVFRQEYLASFETLQNRVYSNFHRTDHLDPDVVDEPEEPLLVGMDFNVHPMAVTFARRVADEAHFLDSWELPSSNTQEVADEINRVWRREAGAPRRHIHVSPDPTGRQRRTASAAGQTDFSILEAAGFAVTAPNAAPLVQDRVNNTQAMLKSADRKIRVRVHPRCKTLIRSWEGLTYKEGTSKPDKNLRPPLDHTADAADYLLWDQFNLLERREARARTFDL